MQNLAAVGLWLGLVGSVAACAPGAEEPVDAADGAYSAVAQQPPAVGRYEGPNGSVLELKKAAPGGLTFALTVAGPAGAVDSFSDADEIAIQAAGGGGGWISKKGACVVRMKKNGTAMTLEESGTCKSGSHFLAFAGDYKVAIDSAPSGAGAVAQTPPPVGRYDAPNGSALVLSATAPGGLTFALTIAGPAGAVNSLSDTVETAIQAVGGGYIYRDGECIVRMKKSGTQGTTAMTLEQTGTCKSGDDFLAIDGQYTLVEE